MSSRTFVWLTFGLLCQVDETIPSDFVTNRVAIRLPLGKVEGFGHIASDIGRVRKCNGSVAITRDTRGIVVEIKHHCIGLKE